MSKKFEDYKHYPITWYDKVIRIGSRGKYVISLGICGKTGRVAFITIYNPKQPISAAYLKMMVVRDIIIGDNICSDGKYCFNLDCPLNKADPKYFRETYGLNMKEVENLHKLFEEIRVKLGLTVKPEKGIIISYEKPPVTISKEKVK